MKKILLLAGLAMTASVYAQTPYAESLFADKFDYNLGNLGTDTTGATPGQGGWLTWISASTPNANNSNFQIVDNASAQGKVLSILGSSNAAGNKIAIQDLTSKWSNREDGSFLQAEYKVFLGDTTSKNGNRFYIWDATGTYILGGIHLVPETGEIKVLAYSTDAASGTTANYIYTFNTPTYTPKNKWVTFGVNWDYSTGTVYYLWDFNDGEGTQGTYIEGAAAGQDVGDLYMGVTAVTSGVSSNSVASTGLFDDVNIFSTDDIYNLGELETLSVTDVTKAKASLSVYPNPTADFLNIASKAKVESTQVYDMSGKAVNVSVSNNQIDVRNLAKGSYVVKIQTAEGVSTQKFIKK